MYRLAVAQLDADRASAWASTRTSGSGCARRSARTSSRSRSGATTTRRSTRVVGYRVQHLLTMGPTKGGIRYDARREPRRGHRARDLDDLEVRDHEPAVRRREGRRAHRPALALAVGAAAHHAPLHLGDHRGDRPRPRHPGARPRHRRAGDGVDHGHLLAAEGPHGAGRGHRQADRDRRLARPRARRPGAAWSRAWSRRAGTSGSPLEGARVVVQGYGNVGARGGAHRAAARRARDRGLRREGRRRRPERARPRQGRRAGCASTASSRASRAPSAVTQRGAARAAVRRADPGRGAEPDHREERRAASRAACSRRGRERPDQRSRPTRSSTSAASSSCPTSSPTPAA